MFRFGAKRSVRTCSRNRRALVVCYIFLSLPSMLLLASWNLVALITDTATSHDDIQTSHYRIVSWTRKYYSTDAWFQEGRKAFTKCELPMGVTCEYSHNRALYASSDALLFSGRFVHQHDLPPTRRADQLWMFFEREPLQHVPGENWHGLKHLFNATGSYTTKADISTPHAYCQKKTKVNKSLVKHIYVKSKSHQIAWFVSNCHAESRRHEYVAELQKYMSVHTYGACGPYECQRDATDACEQLLERKYKFYLAFENSLCGEYFTDKLYRPLNSNAIPIVYGAADYKRIAPPHSYIDIRDFESPKHLAEYLHVLAHNDFLYNQYFQWKATHECFLGRYNEIPCQICRLIHERKISSDEPKEVDVSRIWSGSAQCLDVETFQKNCNCWPKPETTE